MKTALITGVYGQDGSYLSELFYSSGFKIYGICREALSENSQKIRNELQQNSVEIQESHISLYNYDEVSDLIRDIKPDVVFHMAAIHRASTNNANNSIIAEKELYEKNVMATNNLLTACYDISPNTKFVTAGSCLMFDNSEIPLQDECTPFKSNSMYGLAKIAEQKLVEYYRKKGLFACMAILYNHESHRRADHFVTQKIVSGLKAVKSGAMEYLELGDINVRKDWGYAGDYAFAMKLMSEADTPDDYVISSGETHSLKEFIELCAKELDINDWTSCIKLNPQIITRKNNDCLKGNPQKCKDELGWVRTVSFEELIREMINY